MAAALSLSPFPLDHAGPTRMLKDFLQESNGNGKPKTASFKVLAIHAIVAAVKRISFPLVKSPRSLSRRLLRKRDRDEREIGDDFVVKVKDIIRWRSFRDLIDETAETAAPPLDFADSPDRYTAAAMTATSSNSSSWCESDFTAEDLPSPSWSGCSDDGAVGKTYFSRVGEDSTEATNSENDRKVNVLLRCDYDEEEQNVLEEKAKRLLENASKTISLSESHNMMVECCHLNLYQQQLMFSQENTEGDYKRLKSSTTKLAKEDGNDYQWVLSQKGKEAYVTEMEREGQWGVLGAEENVELGLEIEGWILGCLFDEILLDIFQL